jgi:hypothetical protein
MNQMPHPPEAAWTTELYGKTYTVKAIGAHVYSIHCGAEELGSFEFLPHTPHGPTAYANLPPIPRAVANAFVDAYRNENGL